MPTDRTASLEIPALLNLIESMAAAEYTISDENVRILISAVTNLFRKHLSANGYTEAQIRPLCTKFRDAGRRSAPWAPFSKKIPGRPQDGADGNRIKRWLLPIDHKFYADEVNATLVEIKYYFQALSMEKAPRLLDNTIQSKYIWLLGHVIESGRYLDPIQIIPINLDEIIAEPRTIQSGHLIPLDRGGRHVPNNTFLMLSRSNQIQGNQTVDELFDLMDQILKRHKAKKANQ